jgi:hypothetical protein
MSEQATKFLELDPSGLSNHLRHYLQDANEGYEVVLAELLEAYHQDALKKGLKDE